jgi:site-specific recombinase XerD
VVTIKDTKTHQQRLVPLSEAAERVLQFRLARQKADAAAVGASAERNGYVWSSDVLGHDPARPDRLTQSFARTLDRARRDLSGRWPFKLQHLRHFCATELRAAGVAPHVVSAILGHAQESTTANIYTHVLTEQLAGAASALEVRLTV